jgi:crossover junction endodeoxyribonuclease RuvC
MAVSESIGVIKMAAHSEGVEVMALAPKEIKFSLTGNGKADKECMKKSVRQILNVRSPNKKKTHFDDLADALAVAICYARKYVIESPEKDKKTSDIAKSKAKGIKKKLEKNIK